jgi:hypothetical protein
LSYRDGRRYRMSRRPSWQLPQFQARGYTSLSMNRATRKAGSRQHAKCWFTHGLVPRRVSAGSAYCSNYFQCSGADKDVKRQNACLGSLPRGAFGVQSTAYRYQTTNLVLPNSYIPLRLLAPSVILKESFSTSPLWQTIDLTPSLPLRQAQTWLLLAKMPWFRAQSPPRSA